MKVLKISERNKEFYFDMIKKFELGKKLNMMNH